MRIRGKDISGVVENRFNQLKEKYPALCSVHGDQKEAILEIIFDLCKAEYKIEWLEDYCSGLEDE